MAEAGGCDVRPESLDSALETSKTHEKVEEGRAGCGVETAGQEAGEGWLPWTRCGMPRA